MTHLGVLRLGQVGRHRRGGAARWRGRRSGRTAFGVRRRTRQCNPHHAAACLAALAEECVTRSAVLPLDAIRIEAQAFVVVIAQRYCGTADAPALTVVPW